MATNRTTRGKIDLAEVDFDGLTFGEIEDLEGYSGLSFEAVQELLDAHRKAPAGQKPTLPTRLLTTMVYLALKRQAPETTFEDARNTSVVDISFAGSRAKNVRAKAPLTPLQPAKPARRTSRAAAK